MEFQIHKPIPESPFPRAVLESVFQKYVTILLSTEYKMHALSQMAYGFIISTNILNYGLWK